MEGPRNEKNSVKLRVRVVQTLTVSSKNRTVTYSITDIVVNPEILDADANHELPVKESNLLRYFRRHADAVDIEDKDDFIEIPQ